MSIARVRSVMTGVAGAPYYSNLYFTGVATDAQAQNCVDNVDTFFTSQAAASISTLTGTIDAEVAEIDEATGALVGTFATTGGGWVGTASGDILPPSNQGLGRLITSTFAGGRRIRGRIFMPSMMEANSTTGRPVAGYVTSLTASLNALVANASADSSELVVWSRKNGVAAIVTSVSVWTEWASLRSRRD